MRDAYILLLPGGDGVLCRPLPQHPVSFLHCTVSYSGFHPNAFAHLRLKDRVLRSAVRSMQQPDCGCASQQYCKCDAAGHWRVVAIWFSRHDGPKGCNDVAMDESLHPRFDRKFEFTYHNDHAPNILEWETTYDSNSILLSCNLYRHLIQASQLST